MISFNELNKQNHNIIERSKIILFMINDREICDTDVTNSLFFELTDSVKKHIDVEERELYKSLLTHSNHDIRQTAENFLSGSAEIKRVLKQYIKRWSHAGQLRIKDHKQFVQETKEIFEMIQIRIINETEKLYPIVRSVYGDQMAA